jgi:hypothetical protein
LADFIRRTGFSTLPAVLGIGCQIRAFGCTADFCCRAQRGAEGDALSLQAPLVAFTLVTALPAVPHVGFGIGTIFAATSLALLALLLFPFPLLALGIGFPNTHESEGGKCAAGEKADHAAT